MENIFFFRSCRIGLYTLYHSFFTILSGFTLVFPCSHWILSIKRAVITSVTGRCSKCKAWNFAAPVIYSQCLIKSYDFFVPAVHSASAEEDTRFFFFFPRSDWLLIVISVFGRIIQNDFVFYFRVTTQKGSFTSLNSNEKKNVPICSQWFGLLFILVLASDECPSVLCLTKAATFAWQASKTWPPPHLARCRQCAPPIRHCFRN